jgi:eukaryotic-like serine/threonine-protein kinase
MTSDGGLQGTPDPELWQRLQDHVSTEYVLERELAGGGMSRVFVAHQRSLNRRVVIKVLPPSLAASVSAGRFRREILVSAGLQHPQIVPVLTTGELDGLPFFIMPFIEGDSLRMRLQRGPMSIRETINVLRDVTRALAFAHRAGVVHRDIKPDNILLAGDSAVVTDFGVAKALVAARNPETATGTGEVTSVGVSVGTPQYMAPEQAAADPKTDHRADFYALGIVGYEMLTGSPPFHGRRRADLLKAHLAEEPPPLAARRPDTPTALRSLIEKCLRKDPDDRFQAANEIARVLDSPDVASGEIASPAHRPWSAARRNAAVLGGLVGLAILFMGARALLDRTQVTGSPAAKATLTIAIIPFEARAVGDSGLSRDVFADLVGALRTIDGVVIDDGSVPAAVDSSGKTRRMTLRGTLQRSGDRLRVNLRLSNLQGDSTVWAGRLEGTATDLLGFEDQIAKATTAGIEAELKGGKR